MNKPSDGRQRVVIDKVEPEIDGGRFAIRRVIGEKVQVSAIVFSDGHDLISCRLLFRSAGETDWHFVSMAEKGNDCWEAEFIVSKPGRHLYTVIGWVDRFRTWRADLGKRIAAAQDLSVDLQIGAQLIGAAAARASGSDSTELSDWAGKVLSGDKAACISERLFMIMQRYPDHGLATHHQRELVVFAERLKARFSSWYEFFPRSVTAGQGRHGAFRDCNERLRYAASMGFDVIYLPPIHPIGHQFRKGKNNAVAANTADVGSPWAIGDAEGGHTSIHPQLGTLADFQFFVSRAADLKLEVALDIAFQCAPDHPWVREHPDWFRKRPDGNIQYAENPPKKYQDIYPLDFETPQWQELWEALKNVFEFWIGQGIKIFRVDNPHTKALGFWEWVIAAVQEESPDVIFLAEAFTRPHVMYRLAKAGFTQSYTYFTWRNTKAELTAYFTELTQTCVREYFRPNLWPNTPDILPEALQVGGRAAFAMRLLLAATLGANYGIYGPAFELLDAIPREPGSEEYLDSEKYELKRWDVDSPASLQSLIANINRIRVENAALQSDHTLLFHETDNPNLICYSKTSERSDQETPDNVVVVVVNLDCAHKQAGWVTLDLTRLGLDTRHSFQVHELLSDNRFLWQGPRNYVEISPNIQPGHILRVRRYVRTERDFDYYL